MRRCLFLFLLGLLGIASLLLAPLEQLMPAGLVVSPFAFRLLALVNPLVILVAATALGCWLAPKVALHAPAIEAWSAGANPFPILRRQFLPALTTGVGTAVMLIVYAGWSRSWMGAAADGSSLCRSSVGCSTAASRRRSSPAGA